MKCFLRKTKNSILDQQFLARVFLCSIIGITSGTSFTAEATTLLQSNGQLSTTNFSELPDFNVSTLIDSSSPDSDADTRFTDTNYNDPLTRAMANTYLGFYLDNIGETSQDPFYDPTFDNPDTVGFEAKNYFLDRAEKNAWEILAASTQSKVNTHTFSIEQLSAILGLTPPELLTTEQYNQFINNPDFMAALRARLADTLSAENALGDGDGSGDLAEQSKLDAEQINAIKELEAFAGHVLASSDFSFSGDSPVHSSEAARELMPDLDFSSPSGGLLASANLNLDGVQTDASAASTFDPGLKAGDSKNDWKEAMGPSLVNEDKITNADQEAQQLAALQSYDDASYESAAPKKIVIEDQFRPQTRAERSLQQAQQDQDSAKNSHDGSASRDGSTQVGSRYAVNSGDKAPASESGAEGGAHDGSAPKPASNSDAPAVNDGGHDGGNEGIGPLASNNEPSAGISEVTAPQPPPTTPSNPEVPQHAIETVKASLEYEAVQNGVDVTATEYLASAEREVEEFKRAYVAESEDSNRHLRSSYREIDSLDQCSAGDLANYRTALDTHYKSKKDEIALEFPCDDTLQCRLTSLRTTFEEMNGTEKSSTEKSKDFCRLFKAKKAITAGASDLSIIQPIFDELYDTNFKIAKKEDQAAIDKGQELASAPDKFLEKQAQQLVDEQNKNNSSSPTVANEEVGSIPNGTHTASGERSKVDDHEDLHDRKTAEEATDGRQYRGSDLAKSSDRCMVDIINYTFTPENFKRKAGEDGQVIGEQLHMPNSTDVSMKAKYAKAHSRAQTIKKRMIPFLQQSLKDSSNFDGQIFCKHEDQIKKMLNPSSTPEEVKNLLAGMNPSDKTNVLKGVAWIHGKGFAGLAEQFNLFDQKTMTCKTHSPTAEEGEKFIPHDQTSSYTNGNPDLAYLFALKTMARANSRTMTTIMEAAPAEINEYKQHYLSDDVSRAASACVAARGQDGSIDAAWRNLNIWTITAAKASRVNPQTIKSKLGSLIIPTERSAEESVWAHKGSSATRNPAASQCGRTGCPAPKD